MFGRKKLRELEGVLVSYRSLVDKLEGDKRQLSTLVDGVRYERDVWQSKALSAEAMLESCKTLVADYRKTLDAAIERLTPPPPAEQGDGHAMARLKAQLDAQAEEPGEGPAATVSGLTSRIHALFGDDPKPPTTTVWGRTLMKDPQSEE
jgi:hypothetical protein